jgi:predicted lipoprotein with Yx(FWY)xxD motif
MSMKSLFIFALLAFAAVIPVAQGREAAPRSILIAHRSSFGKILYDGRGYVLYAFTRDPRGKSVCGGACARAWPPYAVKSRPRAGAGVTAGRLGTAKRPDGSLQVTYAGRPLYYYVGDRKPGEILCQNVKEFGGLWLVMRPSGRLVR